MLEAMAGPDLRIDTSLHAEDVTLSHDRTRLRQVLTNLVGNAVDATRGYGSRVRIATHVEFVEEATACARGLSHGGEFVVLSVADDGRGMEPTTLARIFDPFFTTKADGRGTGLGLAITQSVVNQAGGFLLVESAPGAGTQFRAFLRGEQSQRVSRVGLSMRVPASSGAPRVLLVSEAGPSRELIAGTLENDYLTVVASGSREAAELLVFEAFDLLITAEHLPDGSGTVLAHSARSLRPELRVVLLSDRADEDAGFDAVLALPIDAASVLEVARTVLDRSAQESLK
jgi:CheY-like chemotaxis protein